MTRRKFVRTSSGLFVPSLFGQIIPFPGPGRAPTAVAGYALVSHLGAGSTDSNGFASSAIDTAGASLLVLVASWYPGTTANVTISDSKSNTWDTSLTAQTFGDHKCKIFFVQNPTVGSGHTFTVAGASSYPCIFVGAFSGALTSGVFDAENGATNNGLTSLQTGSVTPALPNSLVIAGLANEGTTITINSSMSITDSQDNSGNHVAGALAWIVQPSGAINPTWSWGGGTAGNCAVIASFKPA